MPDPRPLTGTQRTRLAEVARVDLRPDLMDDLFDLVAEMLAEARADALREAADRLDRIGNPSGDRLDRHVVAVNSSTALWLRDLAEEEAPR